jgi:hypothetical protein
MAVLRKIAVPNLPVSPLQYSNSWQEQFSNVLRLFFNQLVTTVGSATPYGSFYDTTTQTNPVSGATNIAHLSTVVTQYLCSVESGTGDSRVYVTQSGIYNIQFSAQTAKGGGPTTSIYFWMLQNGINIPNSTGYIAIAPNDKGIAAWNFLLQLQAGDYVQLAWACTDTGATLPAIVPTVNAPASPSIILTINWVSSLSY